jgi:probable rRNA maturation factor
MSRPLIIDIAVEGGEWPAETDLAGIVARAADATIREIGQEPPEGCELSVLFTDDEYIAALNAQWRGKEGPTNVLSFPSGLSGTGDALPAMLGDIVLASETVRREADLESKPLEHHLTHLIVHGLLHLLGHDHEEESEAEEMERLERLVLARLAIADPYG